MKAGDVDHVVEARARALENLADLLEGTVVSGLQVGLARSQTGDDSGQIDSVAADHGIGKAPLVLNLADLRVVGHQHPRVLTGTGIRRSGQRDERGDGHLPVHGCPFTICPPLMTSRTCSTAETSRVGSPTTATRSASSPALISPRSVRRRMRALPEVAEIST